MNAAAKRLLLLAALLIPTAVFADGLSGANNLHSPGPIGDVSPSTGDFTTITATNVLSYVFTSGTSRTMVNGVELIVCTNTCTVTPPGTLVSGSQFCVQNDDNVATVITLAAVANIQYEATARTSYGAANKSMTSGGAVGDQICMIAISTTHYNVASFKGTWTNTP